MSQIYFVSGTMFRNLPEKAVRNRPLFPRFIAHMLPYTYNFNIPAVEFEFCSVYNLRGFISPIRNKLHLIFFVDATLIQAH